jgi:hypothetical protein
MPQYIIALERTVTAVIYMQYSTSDRPEMKDAHTVDELSFPYIYEQNVAVPLKTAANCIIRCNVYRPKETKNGVRLPVLVTYGPYGKDIHYKEYVVLATK